MSGTSGTVRSIQYLLSQLFQDGQPDGSITAQSLRDLIVSIPSVSNFIFLQNTPSSHWTITHNLSYYPSVVIVDSSGTIVEGDISYISGDALSVSFSVSFSGTAYLS